MRLRRVEEVVIIQVPHQNLIGDFNTAITDRQAKLNEMNRPMRPERRTANYNQPGQGVFTPAEEPTFKRSISRCFIYDKVPGY